MCPESRPRPSPPRTLTSAEQIPEAGAPAALGVAAPLDCPFRRWAGFGRPSASPAFRCLPLSWTVRVFLTRPGFPLTPRLRARRRALPPRPACPALRRPVTSPAVSHPDARPSWKFLSPVFPLLLHCPSAFSFSATPTPRKLVPARDPIGSQSLPSTTRPAECVGAPAASGTTSVPPSPRRDSEALTPAAFSSRDSARAGSGPGLPPSNGSSSRDKREDWGRMRAQHPQAVSPPELHFPQSRGGCAVRGP